MGALLDLKSFSRRTRALGAFVGVTIVTMAVWGGGLAFQLEYTRESAAEDSSKIDWTEKGYGGPFVLYFCYGLFDAVWQV